MAADDRRPVALGKLREAINVAEAQSANLFRLRAYHDWARLLVEDCKVEEARNILSPAYTWFTEGF